MFFKDAWPRNVNEQRYSLGIHRCHLDQDTVHFCSAVDYVNYMSGALKYLKQNLLTGKWN